MWTKLAIWFWAVLMLVGSMFTLPAYATVPAGVETVFTGLATDFGVIVGYGWTLFLVVVGGLALFGIARRVFSRTVGR